MIVSRQRSSPFWLAFACFLTKNTKFRPLLQRQRHLTQREIDNPLFARQSARLIQNQINVPLTATKSAAVYIVSNLTTTHATFESWELGSDRSRCTLVGSICDEECQQLEGRSYLVHFKKDSCNHWAGQLSSDRSRCTYVGWICDEGIMSKVLRVFIPKTTIHAIIGLVSSAETAANVCWSHRFHEGEHPKLQGDFMLSS